MTKLKIGILGFANIAKKAIIPAIQASENFDLYGIASRSQKNKETVESEYKCKFYDDYLKMVEDEAMDALYIPLPNSLHYPWAKKALEHNKHLLVEKSLGCTLEEVKNLNQLAKEKGLALVENFQFRKHSQLATIKQLMENGEVGDIRAIKISFGFPPFADKSNIRYTKDLGGGALLDAGAYPIKLSQELLGYDLEITAATMNNNNMEVDIWGGGMIKDKKSPNFVQFSFGFDHYYQCSIEIWGSKAKLFTNRIFTAPPGYSPTLTMETQEGVKTLHLEADNHYVNMLAHFYNCTNSLSLKEEEYRANTNQALLLENFYNLAITN